MTTLQKGTDNTEAAAAFSFPHSSSGAILKVILDDLISLLWPLKAQELWDGLLKMIINECHLTNIEMSIKAVKRPAGQT